MLGAMKGAIDPKKVLAHIYVNECQNRNTQSYHCILATVYRSLYPNIEQNKKRRLIIRVIQKPVSLHTQAQAYFAECGVSSVSYGRYLLPLLCTTLEVAPNRLR
jgi:hypothetical protein